MNGIALLLPLVFVVAAVLGYGTIALLAALILVIWLAWLLFRAAA